MKPLIIEDIKTVKVLINFRYEETKIKINNGNTLDEIISELHFIDVPDKNSDEYDENDKPTKNKEKLIRFEKCITRWLKEIEFFEDVFDEGTSSFISSNQVAEHKKDNPIVIEEFIPRVNQKEAFDKIDKEGIKTGIHCQATGCGKSYIILKYIEKSMTLNPCPKVILFTERVSVLADLFRFKKGMLKKDKKNVKKWKDLGICDITSFNIIDRCTNKTKDWIDILKNSREPTLLVINRAFLTTKEQYTNITNNELHLVLHDECHNTGSTQCFKFLTHCLKIDVKIVGFSATPLRTGKNDAIKLLDIYGQNDRLNLLTNYNMIFAIQNKLILPPEFYWYEIENLGRGRGGRGLDLVTQEELGSVLQLLDSISPNLPNRKIVAWCGTIKLAKEWKRLFEANYKQRKGLKDFEFGIDTSATKENNYEEFRESDGNYILFCANKHREGSDVKKLDCCVFLDKVKNRGCIPFIQSIGRVLRLCPTTIGKTKGVIIDGFVKDRKGYEREFVMKIIGYYMSLQNITNVDDSDELESNYDKYVRLLNSIKFNIEKNLIQFDIGNNNRISIVLNKLEWKQMEIFEEVLQHKIKIGTEDNFKHKGTILKREFGFGINTDFIVEYANISTEDKLKFNLPDINSAGYSEMLNGGTWFNLLEIEHDYYEFNDFIEAVDRFEKYKGNWKKLHKKDNRIPEHPEYVYINFVYNDDDIQSII